MSIPGETLYPGDPGRNGPPDAGGFTGLRCAVPGFGERPVQRCDRRVLPGVLARPDGQLEGDLRHGDALVPQRCGEGQHVVVDDLRAAAVVALRRGGLLALKGLLPDVLAIELGGHGQDGEQHRAHPAWVVDPGQRADSSSSWIPRPAGRRPGSSARRRCGPGASSRARPGSPPGPARLP